MVYAVHVVCVNAYRNTEEDINYAVIKVLPLKSFAYDHD